MKAEFPSGQWCEVKDVLLLLAEKRNLARSLDLVVSHIGEFQHGPQDIIV